MKKTLFIMLSALLLIACQGEQGPAGKDGKDGIDGLASWHIKDLDTKQAGGWQYTNFEDNNYFYRVFEVEELTQFVYDSGNIQCYKEENTGTANAFQRQLPFTQYLEDFVLPEGDSLWVRIPYQEKFDYAFGIGWVEVKMEVSDFIYEDDVTWEPKDAHFRLVLQW